jgi:hypothetical protein
VVRRAIRFTHTDAALLAQIGDGWWFRHGTSLKKLLENYDFDQRDVPTYDDVSYGLARLVAAGYVRATYSPTNGIRLYATPRRKALVREAEELRRRTSPFRWPRIGEVSFAIAELLNAERSPKPDDRTIGRLPRLDQAAWDEVVASYNKEWDETLRRARPAANVLALMGRLFVSRRRGREDHG